MGTKVKKYTRVDDKRYKLIKHLLSLDLSASQITDIAGGSYETVRRIRRSNDFAEYKQNIVEMKAKYMGTAGDTPTEVIESGQPEKVEPVADKVDLVDLNKNLERIAEAVENLVAAWDKSPAKKKLF